MAKVTCRVLSGEEARQKYGAFISFIGTPKMISSDSSSDEPDETLILEEGDEPYDYDDPSLPGMAGGFE